MVEKRPTQSVKTSTALGISAVKITTTGEKGSQFGNQATAYPQAPKNTILTN